MIDERTTIDWAPELADQLDWHWRFHVRPRLDDLTDEELHWEPVPGCWGVRPQDDGTWMADIAFPAPEPPPVTTIAWRLGHVAVGCFGARAASHFGAPAIDYMSYQWPGTAAQTLADLDELYERWMSGVKGLTDDDLTRCVGPAEGEWHQHSMATLVLHINREAIHHGAECLVLRDLYRASADAKVGIG
jgi:hypothetical protein